MTLYTNLFSFMLACGTAKFPVELSHVDEGCQCIEKPCPAGNLLTFDHDHNTYTNVWIDNQYTTIKGTCSVTKMVIYCTPIFTLSTSVLMVKYLPSVVRLHSSSIDVKHTVMGGFLGEHHIPPKTCVAWIHYSIYRFII